MITTPIAVGVQNSAYREPFLLPRFKPKQKKNLLFLILKLKKQIL